MTVLILNFVAYLIWSMYAYKKRKKYTLYFFVVLFYTFMSFLSIYTISNGTYYDAMGKFDINKLSYTPYILCFITYYILFYPLKKIEIGPDNSESLFSKNFYLIMKIWVIFFFLFTCLKFYEALETVSTGLGAAYDARHNEGEVLFTYSNPILQKFNGYGTFLLRATSPIAMYFSIIGMYKGKINKHYAAFIIILCFAPFLFESIGQGTRGGLFMSMFKIIFFLVLMWKYIPSKFKLTIIKIFLFISFGILFYSWIITLDRIGEKNGMSSIFRYFGESFPNLGLQYWDQVKHHPWGARLFPNLLFDDNYINLGSTNDTFSFWEMYTGVPVLYFKTFFGDLYIEFGTIIALLITFLLSFLMCKFLNIKILGVCQLPLCFLYFEIVTFAFAGMYFRGSFGFFQLEITVAITLMLYFFFIRKKNANINEKNDTNNYQVNQ